MDQRSQTVLFVCPHGALRSPMAAALLTARSGGTVAARSAGLDPDPAMSPIAIAALREIGVEVGEERPSRWSARASAAGRVVWLGGPLPLELAGQDVECWDVDTPRVDDLPAARRLRQELERRVAELLARESA
jgi:arsenate reductase (thioredoxin)